jgi:hypothetical protein
VEGHESSDSALRVIKQTSSRCMYDDEDRWGKGELTAIYRFRESERGKFTEDKGVRRRDQRDTHRPG